MLEHLRSGIGQWRALGVGEKFLWKNARMVFAQVPVEAEAVRDWLPFGLTLAEPARATVFIGDYPHTTFAPHYQEAALLLHAKLFGVIPVVYCPWMVLNNDRAMILGREMLGLPKKMALVSFSERRGKITGSVVRHGIEVLRIEGSKSEPVKKPKAGLGQAVVGLRGLLNVLLPAHLLLFFPRETVHECHALSHATVTLRGSQDDPIGIAAGEASDVTVRTCDIGAGMLPLRVFPVSPLFLAHQMALRLR